MGAGNMTETLGQMIYERDIDRAVRETVEEAFSRATTILKDRRATLEAGARALLEHETLSEDALHALVS